MNPIEDPGFLALISNSDQVLASSEELDDIRAHSQIVVDGLHGHHSKEILLTDGELIESSIGIGNYEHIAFAGI